MKTRSKVVFEGFKEGLQLDAVKENIDEFNRVINDEEPYDSQNKEE